VFGEYVCVIHIEVKLLYIIFTFFVSFIKKVIRPTQVGERKVNMNNLFYDGFNSKLIETAMFESLLEIPILAPPKQIRIPRRAIPLSKLDQLNDPFDMLVFYEQDPIFRDFVSIPQNYDTLISKVEIMSTPDCSLYRDMPLWEQLANIGVARSIGYYEQQHGKYVIPNVRWGDERTYTNIHFDIPPTFAGIPKNSIVSIGTYGCCQKREDKYHLEAFLESMLEYLMPSDVVVYGSFNKRYMQIYEKYTNFHIIPDWITYKRGGQDGNK
jgi:hypothetical protein